ncbi:MAG: Unknown protein [uncultured Thiotrichaceae bacterium]|uniref:Glycosyltransferase 2-like domain-containing protein n=1 Tax=uncultured Thiotrichaceae bacterium TaxID=298394 RepID=A0A6S6TT71_9GAMM|nr:MAG: Unknown protein [uncultured Thiotrichaceae bacterium]
MSTKAVTQYLQRYAEPETAAINHWPDDNRHYQHVVVIPAYQESSEFLQRALQSDWFQRDVLLILVVNQPDTQTDFAPQQQLFEDAVSCGEIVWQQENLTLIAGTAKSPSFPLLQRGKSSSKDVLLLEGTPLCILSFLKKRDGGDGGDLNLAQHGDLLLINRFNTPLPAKYGVGLARKIGTDIALALITKDIISSKWICSTDADALLPDDYFSVLSEVNPEWVAACYAFEHVGGESEVQEATLIYQQAMHYYVNGLKNAGSPYAHFTIGSTLAFKATAYANVRGFPKRAAGEDFYLLNKLIKSGKVGRIEQTTIQLQARLSERVPFGTGMSAANIMQLTAQGKPFCYYHPQTFVVLRQVLQHFDKLWASLDDLPTWLSELPGNSGEILLQAGLTGFITKQQRQRTTKKQFDAQLMGWFDGLKTLQFIHGLRDTIYPDVPLVPAPSMSGRTGCHL